MRKNIAANLLAQCVVTTFGTKEYESIPFMNVEIIKADGEPDFTTPPANLRLRITNEPAVDYRSVGEGANRKKVAANVCVISQDEVVRYQMATERRELTGNRRAQLDADELARLEYYESLRVLEYTASIEVWYGKDDQVTAAEALGCQELIRIGPEVEGKIGNGIMDVCIADDRRRDNAGNFKPANASRPHCQTLNLWPLRRIVAKNTVGASFPEDMSSLKPGEMFYVLTGSCSQKLGQSGNFPTHVVVGRMPDAGARRRRDDFRNGGRLGQGKRGQPRRGWAIVIPIDFVVQADMTYQDRLIPTYEQYLEMKRLKDMKATLRMLISLKDEMLQALSAEFLLSLKDKLAHLEEMIQKHPMFTSQPAQVNSDDEESILRTKHLSWLLVNPVYSGHDAIEYLMESAAVAPATRADATQSDDVSSDEASVGQPVEQTGMEPEAEAKAAEVEASSAETQGQAPVEPAKAEEDEEPRLTMSVLPGELESIIPEAPKVEAEVKAEDAVAKPAKKPRAKRAPKKAVAAPEAPKPEAEAAPAEPVQPATPSQPAAAPTAALDIASILLSN